MAANQELAGQDLDRLAMAARAEQVLQLRRLLDGLEGQWLKELAAVDGRGAAGADQGEQAASTAAWLRARLRLGSVPLEVGRTTRVVQPTQRIALAVSDRGGVVPDRQPALAWCDAHQLRHWLAGGPTDLANLALGCRAHHRAVHAGGWQLTRGPDGRCTATHPTGSTTRRRLIRADASAGFTRAEPSDRTATPGGSWAPMPGWGAWG